MPLTRFTGQQAASTSHHVTDQTDTVRAKLEELGITQDNAIAWADPDDAPELTDAFFEEADEYVGDTLVRRGRPKAASPKQTLTVRYDADLVAAFKATGKGWQTRMNAAVKDWLKTHSPV